MIKVSVVGATGYTGIELIRLLLAHPEVEICELFSNSFAGKNLSDIYPNFRGNKDFILKEYDSSLQSEADIFFTALPHGVSQTVVAELYQKGHKVIDLSGDYRYKEKSVYEKWYECEHKYPELLSEMEYGLVEFNENKLKQTRLIANPGCYPTASLLGLLPVIKEGKASLNSVIIDAKSGVSGAGKSLKRTNHFIEANESIKAYGVTTHRHTSEIESYLKYFSTFDDINITFTPHLVPMKRGILATIYVDLEEDNYKENQLREIYIKYYKEKEFVKILEDSLPETKYVYGTNYCHIGIRVDSKQSRAIIISAIDNLGKGAAGQAVQNMNIMFGLPEVTGLKDIGMFP